MPKIRNRFGVVSVVSGTQAQEMILKDGATLVKEVVIEEKPKAVKKAKKSKKK